jgi:hypothetical protein
MITPNATHYPYASFRQNDDYDDNDEDVITDKTSISTMTLISSSPDPFCPKSIKQSQNFLWEHQDQLNALISLCNNEVPNDQKKEKDMEVKEGPVLGKCREPLFNESTKEPSVPTTNNSKFLLHQACYLYPTNLSVIRSALILEVSSLQIRVPTPVMRSHSPYGSNNSTKRCKKQTLLPSLPLHIAIHNQGSLEVLKYLTMASPDVVAMKDGPEECNAISALLYQGRFDSTLLAMLLKWNQGALSVVDHFQNTSLHVACSQGAPFEIVYMIYNAYPEAFCQRNGMGQMPIQVAQTNGLSTIDVIDFLQELLESPLELNACHLDSV